MPICLSVGLYMAIALPHHRLTASTIINMFTFLSAFAPASNIDPEHIELHVALIADQVIAVLQCLPKSEDSFLMPRWELGLAKEVVCLRWVFFHADSANTQVRWRSRPWLAFSS